MNRAPGRRVTAALCGLALAALALPFANQRSSADELVDMTLLFHSAVQGKIAPCG